MLLLRPRSAPSGDDGRIGHVADRRTANVKERWLFSYVVNGRRPLSVGTRPDVAADSDRRVNVNES